MIDEYGKKHLVAHLVDAHEWDKIEELIDDPIWGEEAKKALGRHNKSLKPTPKGRGIKIGG